MYPSYLDKELLGVLERAFAHHAGADAVIDFADLKRALGLKSDYLAGRMLRLFDLNGDGVITQGEFIEGVRALVFGSDREKLWFAFRLHDHDGDGTIDRQELLRMISMSLAESEIAEKLSQPPEYLTRALLSAADRNRDGRISFDEFVEVVMKRPELLRRMTRNEAIWIAPNEELLVLVDERAAGMKLPSSFLEHGVAPYVLLGFFVLANIGIFTASMILGGAFVTSNPLMEAGRAAGLCLDFCGAFILIPMMRRLMTWIRSSWLGRVLPLDESVDFHRFVGHSLFFLALFHAGAFIAAFAIGHSPSSLADFLVGERFLTGGALIVVFAIMWLCSLSFIRRSRRFELFASTHLLWIAWFILAIAHAPPFALWAGVPLLGFLIEQLVRLSRRGPPNQVVSGRPQRSGVTRLEIARPPDFDFGAGDYVFLRIPAVAKREWHPFTISSAPERKTLTFHVRSLGNWTAALRRRVDLRPDEPGLVAYVDGPYGSPSAHIFQSRCAVMIGAGIGVTPFASVLESIVLRAYGWGNRPSNLQKVHFFWLNRDQYSFEWFSTLLAELEKLDLRGLLEIHLCLTGARSGATAMGLEVAREVMKAWGRSDIITGLRTHTHVGPPDWDAMLGEICRLHQDQQIDVFFCGPPGLGRKLRPICEGLGMSFREERF